MPAKEKASRESSVGAGQRLDMTAGSPGQATGVLLHSQGVSGGGVSVGGAPEDNSVGRTAQLVATCTAAATAAVLKATHLQVYIMLNGVAKELGPVSSTEHMLAAPFLAQFIPVVLSHVQKALKTTNLPHNLFLYAT